MPEAELDLAKCKRRIETSIPPTTQLIKQAFRFFALSTNGKRISEIAEREGLAYTFEKTTLDEDAHPNSVRITAERGGRSQIQCDGRPYAFVVHGLWPQYENGFPEYCQRPAPRLNRNIVSSMLDLMPAPGLIFNEWDKHGTCSGLEGRSYFETIRKARAAIKIPAEYLALSQARTVAPTEVEELLGEVLPTPAEVGAARAA